MKWPTDSVHLFSSWINKCISLYAHPVGSLLKMKMWTKIQAIKCIIIKIWKLTWQVIIDYDGMLKSNATSDINVCMYVYIYILIEIQADGRPAGYCCLTHLHRCLLCRCAPLSTSLGINGSSAGDHQSWMFRSFNPSTSPGGGAMAGIIPCHPLLMP